MLAPLDLAQQLHARLTELAPGLPWSRADGTLSLVLEASLPPLHHCPCSALPQYFFSSPSRQESRYGVGEAVAWQFRGPRRLRNLQDVARRLRHDWLCRDPDETGIRPSALLGFAHHPDDPMRGLWRGLPNTLLRIPELLLHSRPGHGAVILSCALPADPDKTLARWRALLDRILPLTAECQLSPLPESRLQRILAQPDRDGWMRQVSDALDAISSGALRKIVPARRIRVRGARPFDAQRLSAALAYLFPSCQIIDLQSGPSHLAAATPERLLALCQGRLRVDAIAGTAPRAADREQDRALARGLFDSPRIRTEHGLVVRQLTEALASRIQDLSTPPEPQLMPLANVQHLSTPLQGRISADDDLVGLARALHPSPSVSGYPPDAARQWLTQHETLDRGWYTGAVGWLDDQLEGELWVMLRCALLDADCAELYAGAGLVEGSDAAGEYRETEHKFDGMLAALRYA